MSDSRSQLLTRKRDIFAAVRLLEQDHHDGAMDDAAYRAARRRYELEAAEILQRLDALPPEPQLEGPALRAVSRTAGSNRSRMIVGATGAVVVAAIALFLLTALHPRSGSQTITGNGGQALPATAAPTSPQLRAAERAVVLHPRSVDALINLGNAYLNAGQPALADRSYRRAIQLAPGEPQAQTLDAVAIASEGRFAQALAILRKIERDHPTYSRAWLTDGLLSSRSPSSYPRAIAAFERFLALDPHSSVSSQVRQSIQAMKRAGK
jgi:tetratricopeptide (TPR) repeat protein